jgi:hypothetical protein
MVMVVVLRDFELRTGLPEHLENYLVCPSLFFPVAERTAIFPDVGTVSSGAVLG